MLIADVIVDVPTRRTDTPFSYRVPELLEESIKKGMRVVVPFGKGGRRIQGFVIDLKEISSEEMSNQSFHIKQISELLDLHAVVNSEMISLSNYLSQTYFAFRTDCLQTMLPRVLRVAYDKKVKPTSLLTEEETQLYFPNSDELKWDTIIENQWLKDMVKLKKEEKINIIYEVKTKNKVKVGYVFSSNLEFQQLEKIKKSLRKTASQQLKLISLLQLLDNQVMSVREAKEKYGINRATLTASEKKGWLSIQSEEIYRNPYAHLENGEAEIPLELNVEQKNAYDTIKAAQEMEESSVFLLEGVTGSGKTEVYLHAIANALRENKTAIMLVPEIALTPQTVERFKLRFGDEVAVLHSGLSDGEKYDEWRKIEREEARVVVGARSAIFAPLKNIGVLIVDEEHESSYKQEDTPRYHARDVAIWRGDYHNCPVILGSATPSLESRARAQKNVYHLLKLNKRAQSSATLPTVDVIDMREELSVNQLTNFSSILLSNISESLEREEQVILLLNRRGYASYVMCRECGFVLPCPNCDISLTLHKTTNSMKCHYCGHEERIPTTCPSCGSDKIRNLGTGTQKIEEELIASFPNASIARMDVDTTRKKGAHEEILSAFGHGEIDILLGTQMIAKGLDFPNVTLVGVLNADTALNLPDFRASERTFQLLTQVSGRAGRADKAGKVVIQTFNPEHYAIHFARAQDYESFYQYEMTMRHRGDYPPYYYIVQVVASDEKEINAVKEISTIINHLKNEVDTSTIILGPTAKSIARMNNRYYYQAIIKHKGDPKLMIALHQIMSRTQHGSKKSLFVSIDVEPMTIN